MAQPLDYKRLREIIREEKASPNLAKLPQDFLPSLESFLSSKFREAEQQRSIMQMRELENAIAIIKEICAIRQQKILFRALRNGSAHGPTENMTDDEHALYDRFRTIISEERGRFDALLCRFERKTASADASEGQQESRPAPLKKLRFTKEVPAYRGANNETIGPFKPGQESFLPAGEAEWLLKSKLAEEAADG
ncbi:MAG: hypothetical protein N3E51_04200 [Candidatus Micrarchaeota archaeon]|nr:hypothetical protein [Candidatus Micrarchaeota archaeon]